MANKEFKEGEHFYLDNGKVIMTELFHKERGFCCGNKCKHCPYENSIKGTTKLREIIKGDNTSDLVK